jgi:drug/metabolite transporter (DMT)-like permease
MPFLTDRRWAVALVFITPALWSVNYLVGRTAPGVVAPHMLALLRWSLAGLILLAFAWPELLAKRSLVLKNAWHYVVFGALGMWICGAWVYLGARSTSATNIALIYALSPVFIALVSSFLLRERLGLLGANRISTERSTSLMQDPHSTTVHPPARGHNRCSMTVVLRIKARGRISS